MLREQGGGIVMQFSSMGGRVGGSPGIASYQAAKFAIDGFSRVLQAETAPFGVKVIVVEPSGFKTDWAGSSMIVRDIPESYTETVGAINRRVRQNPAGPAGDPVRAAEILVQIAKRPAGPPPDPRPRRDRSSRGSRCAAAPPQPQPQPQPLEEQHGSGMPVFRNRDAQVPAQRAGLVLGADRAALAQDGHHLVEEPPELGGVPDVDVGPVQGALGEPPLEDVRHRLRGADERGRFRGGQELHGLPQGEVAIPGQLDDLLGVMQAYLDWARRAAGAGRYARLHRADRSAWGSYHRIGRDRACTELYRPIL